MINPEGNCLRLPLLCVCVFPSLRQYVGQTCMSHRTPVFQSGMGHIYIHKLCTFLTKKKKSSIYLLLFFSRRGCDAQPQPQRLPRGGRSDTHPRTVVITNDRYGDTGRVDDGAHVTKATKPRGGQQVKPRQGGNNNTAKPKRAPTAAELGEIERLMELADPDLADAGAGRSSGSDSGNPLE